MKAVYVPPVRTPISFAEASDSVHYALKRVLDEDPRIEVHALALAKLALESGRFTQMWGFNPGNVKAGADYAGNFTCITLNELIKGKLVWFSPEGQLSANPAKGGKLIGDPLPVPDGHPQTRMRKYANHYDGMISYIEFVSGSYYKAAWAQLLKGDPVAYVHALKLACYFTADEALYRKGVVSLYSEMLARLRKEEPPPKVDLGWEALREQVAGCQFDLAAMVDGDFEEAT